MEIDYDIEWHGDYAETQRQHYPATRQEIISMLEEIKRQALDTKPGEVIQINGRREVVDVVASGINNTKSGYAIVNLHDEPRYNADLKCYESHMMIAIDQIAMKEYLNNGM